MNKFAFKNGYGLAANKSIKNEKQTNGNGFNKGFSTFLVYHKPNNFQCQKCGSDYAIGASNGICIDCLQRVEFIIREHPQMFRQFGGAAK